MILNLSLGTGGKSLALAHRTPPGRVRFVQNWRQFNLPLGGKGGGGAAALAHRTLPDASALTRYLLSLNEIGGSTLFRYENLCGAIAPPLFL